MTCAQTDSRARAGALRGMIEHRGGAAILFPVAGIAAPRDRAALAAELAELARINMMIFISAAAIESTGGVMREHGLRIPRSTRIAAIGPKTAAACARAGRCADFVARARSDSEGLLDELRGFDAAGKRVLIFRGQSGREHLRRALESRGAAVRHIETYRREPAAPPLAPLLQRWRGGEIDAVLITGATLWDALSHRLGGARGLLEATPVFAYSARIAAHCRRAGAREVHSAVRPSDDALVAALAEWAAARASHKAPLSG
ncbi:MAG: uroporphyrinogen-III synthase [Gammaproteobacteria bacterium]